MMTSSNDELIRRGATPPSSIEHLTVVRGKRTAVDDVSVRIARGTITGLLGPSGCGKTTLMRCIVGTQIIAVRHGHGARPSGRIRRTAPPRRLRHPGPDHLRRPAGDRQRPLLRVAVRHRRRTRPTSLDRGGPDDHRTALCGNLSGGQRTPGLAGLRTGGDPDLLVLDEPTVGLDPVLRVDLWEQFDALARRGTTLLVSSHVMDEADHCGDLLLMREGHLLAHTTPTATTRGHGMQSLEEAFLSVIRHSTAAAAG